MAAQDELELLDRVFLRIGTAESDQQLENVICRFLPPVLLKLSSSQEGVRKKVLELLVHVNKRLKSRPMVHIPVETLLLQYQDPSSNTFITNFTIMYLKMGYPRLDNKKQAELAPSLIKCLEGKPSLQQDSILQMLIPALPSLELPSDPAKRRAMFGLSEKIETIQLLSTFMMDYLLLPYTFSEERSSSAPADANTAAANTSRHNTEVNYQSYQTPPGLSPNALKRLIGEQGTLDAKTIEECKVGIVQFLSSDVLSETEVICHLIVASSDTHYSVATAADVFLKKIHSGIDWNDAHVVRRLFALFQGSVAVKGQPTPKPEEKRAPVSTRTRLKLFPYLLRSRLAADQFPACIQVIFDCLYGANPHNKLKSMAVQFVHHLCSACSDARMQPMGPILLSGMVKLIAETTSDAKLRSLAYIAVGKLSRRLPHLFTKDLGLLQQFFDAVCKETDDTRLHVQDALFQMAEAYKGVEEPLIKVMEMLIMANIEKPEPQARMAAVHYAATVFPSHHVPSRYVLLLATGDSKEDIQQESMRALKLSEDNIDDRRESQACDVRTAPTFTEIVPYISNKASHRLKSSSRYVTSSTVLAFRPETFRHVIFYIRSCLFQDAGCDVPPEVQEAVPLGKEAPAVSRHINQMLSAPNSVSVQHENVDSNNTGWERNPVLSYMTLIGQLLNGAGTPDVMYCLLELVAMAPDQLSGYYINKLDWIKSFVFAISEPMRDTAAQLYAVIACRTSEDRLESILQVLIKNAKNQSVECQHGSILAMGYIIGCQFHLTKKAAKNQMEDDMDIDRTPSQTPLQATIISATQLLVSSVDNSNMLISHGACVALGEIARNGPLPIPDGQLLETGADDAKSDDIKNSKKGKMPGRGSAEISKAGLIHTLVSKLDSIRFSMKVKEQVCTTLGFLPVGQPNFEFTQTVLEGLFSSGSSKQVELHFSVGDALAQASLGTLSSASRDVWTEDEQPPSTSAILEKRGENGSIDWVEWTLNRILKEEIKSQNPHKRHAACLWLLSLVKKCSSHPFVQEHLGDVQRAFIDMLSENDEFTQDVASKGLSVVYEESGEEGRSILVSTLVDTLASGKRATKTNVTGDTKIFEEGSLGRNPEGGGLPTYRELCSLASDLNQPDLIYKFMHLANHNAMWTSRKGAAFGFGTIAAQAREQLAPHLHQILPKLYRYQYDPNSSVRSAMTGIWSAVVKDKSMVSKYLKEIVEDLIENITSGIWRNRESSCLALSDLLRGRNVDDIVDYLPELWEKCFLVLDDIKESVRKAAESSCRSLSKVCVKMCDIGYGKIGQHAIRLVLPCLLKGLPSRVKEVRTFSLSTLVDMSSNAGDAIKPHIPQLVIALLEALSGLEPQLMNYISLHVGSDENAQEKLDNARIAASKSSPMMETVKMCVQYIDAEVLNELAPRVNDLIRSGIGVATKAGCANLLILLSHQCPLELGAHAGKLLASLLSGLSDKSMAVRKHNASAIGHLVKVAKDSSVEKLISRLKLWYLEKDDGGLHEAIGAALQAMSRQNPDILKRHAAMALPLAFLAMHQTKQTDSRGDEKECVWEEVWLDSTPGTEGGIRLYLTEIVTITKECLRLQSWPRKAQAARAMSTVATKLGSRIQPSQLSLLLGALLDGLQGRTWDGKDELLRAISTVCISCKTTLQNEVDSQPAIDTVIIALFKESRKERIDYKISALDCLAAVLQEYNNDRFVELAEILYPIISKKTGDDSSDDEEMDRSYQDQKLKLKESAFANLGIAWPSKLETQKKECVHLCRVLCEGVEGSTFKIQLAILKSLHLFFQRLYLINADDVSSDDTETLSAILEMLVPAVYKTLGIVKYAAIRKKSLEVLEFLIPKFAEPSRQTVLSYWEAHDLQEALSKVTSDPDPAVRERAVLLKNVIKEAFVNDKEEEDKDALSMEKGDEDLVEKEGTSFE